MKPYEKIINALQEGYDDDHDNQILSDAMEYYCSMYDIREGMKYALRLTLQDQYENHNGEQSKDDLVELKKILGL